MNTRNMNEKEIEGFERLQREMEAIRLDMIEFETGLRHEYAIPEEAGLQANGRITLGGGSLRKKPRRGAPKRLADKIPIEEIDKLSGLRAGLGGANLALDRFVLKLREECDAPFAAKLDGKHRWMTPDGKEYYVPLEGNEEDEEDEGDEPLEEDEFDEAADAAADEVAEALAPVVDLPTSRPEAPCED